jgi:hypothetical protein
MPRFMVIVKSGPQMENGQLPSAELRAAMDTFNDELVAAGVRLAAEGLQPTSKGALVTIDGAKHTVIDGPFTETKELIAGFWLWQCRDLAEAIAWAKRCPSPMDGGGQLEIRQLFEADDVAALVANQS